MKKIAIIGFGYVGQAIGKMFENHYDLVIYDPALTKYKIDTENGKKIELDSELTPNLKARVKSCDLAIKLCDYEARGCQPEIKNPNSSATGLYQFIEGTWRDLCEGEVTNPEHNADCAMRLISAGDIFHWTADKNTRAKLLEWGYVECPNPERNYCKLKPRLVRR